jgi:hypothetical protein
MFGNRFAARAQKLMARAGCAFEHAHFKQKIGKIFQCDDP